MLLLVIYYHSFGRIVDLTAMRQFRDPTKAAGVILSKKGSETL